MLAVASTICRASAGDCDVAESCTGSTAECPSDVLAAASVVCRPAAGDCDVAESCTGTNAACPDDSFASVAIECRPSAGECDLAESCTGSGVECPGDAYASSTTVCRAATSDCDRAEICDGNNPNCPIDILADAGATCDDCPAGAGNCDACNAAGVCVNQCGDGQVDDGEACDGGDAESCPGFCQSSCTCGVAPSCLAYFENGATLDGTYSIDPDGTGAISVYCDMTGGGYTYWVHDGLVAYWSFDGTGFASADVGGITGTAVGAVPQQTVVPGSDFGTSAHFNGDTANRIELANGITMPAASTFMFWARPESCTNNRAVLVHETRSIWLGDVRFAAFAYKEGTVFQNGTDTCTPGIGSWSHSTFVDTGTAMSAYRNGVSVAPTTYSYSSFSGVLLNRIGSRANFGTNGMHGWLDDIAVFDRALTAAEIDLIHAQGRLGRPLRWR